MERFFYIMADCGKIESKNVFTPKARQFDDGKETNLYDIALQICNAPPQAPNTICLIMDHDIPENTDFTDFEFELVSVFTMACIKVLFGYRVDDDCNVNPATLSETDWQLLKKYLHSIGYDVNINKEETNNAYQIKLKFNRYEKINPYKHLEKYMAK